MTDSWGIRSDFHILPDGWKVATLFEFVGQAGGLALYLPSTQGPLEGMAFTFHCFHYYFGLCKMI